MLYHLESLVGSPVIATDGESGSIRDFLFDDQSWTVRYLVVDVGNWLKRRTVVLPIAAVEQPDWAKKICHARLTKAQMRDSPDVDTAKPVSRQQEIAMRDYYGKFADWVNSQHFPSHIPAGGEYPVHTVEDPHLRSTADLLGYYVRATDGEFGTVDGFVMEEASWQLGYLDVKCGDWLLSRLVLVPTRWVRSISWADHRVDLRQTRAGAELPLEDSAKQAGGGKAA